MDSFHKLGSRNIFNKLGGNTKTDEQYNTIAKALGYCPYDIQMAKMFEISNIKEDVQRVFPLVKELITNGNT